MYAAITPQQREAVVRKYHYARSMGATDPMHAAAIASDVLCSERQRSKRGEANAWAATLAILVMAREINLSDPRWDQECYQARKGS